MSCFFIPSLHNLMVVNPSLLKSSENIGRDGQNQLFQNSWNLPKASNNLRSIYSRKTAESHWAGFVALQLELLPSLFAQVCSNLENQQACSHWMGRACWGASKKKKKKKGPRTWEAISKNLAFSTWDLKQLPKHTILTEDAGSKKEKKNEDSFLHREVVVL